MRDFLDVTEPEQHRVYYESKPFSHPLTTIPKQLMELCSLVELRHGAPFSFVGGFTRDYGVRDYNDIDIATTDPYLYRDYLAEMGVLILGDSEQVEGPNAHDYFIDPYDMSEEKIAVHFIQTHNKFGFAPDTFDFAINEFSLKSDGQLYAPTYAWREHKKKILHLKSQSGMTTNQFLRSLRIQVRTGFTFSKETVERLELFANSQDKLASNRVLYNIDKMIEDGVEDACYALMREFKLVDTDKHETIHSFRKFHNDLILSGRALVEHPRRYAF